MCPPPYRPRSLAEILIDTIASSPRLQRDLIESGNRYRERKQDEMDWLDYVGTE